MPDNFCKICHVLLDDGASHCSRCKLPTPANPTRGSFAIPVISFLVGAIITAIFARLIHLSWSKWSKLFPSDNFSDDSAEEAALLMGIAVFLIATIATTIAIKLRPTR